MPATRDIFWCGLYTGLRVSEVFGLHWDRLSLSRRLLRVDDTKTGKPLLPPATRQLAEVGVPSRTCVLPDQRHVVRGPAARGAGCFRSRAIALRRPLEHEGWETAPAGLHSS